MDRNNNNFKKGTVSSMKIAVIGDSIARGIILDRETGAYRPCENSFSRKLDRLEGISVENIASFGATITKSLKIVQRHAAKIQDSDLALVEVGGNDSDFSWREIAKAPELVHEANTPPERYRSEYVRLLHSLRDLGIEPVVLNLPPISSQRYFAHFSASMKEAEKENIVRWLQDDIEQIYEFHRGYSLAAAEIAEEEKVRFIDIRHAFVRSGVYDSFLCDDGIHPTEIGQHLMYERIAAELFR
jgi:acyl-CoA thioesterase-1